MARRSIRLMSAGVVVAIVIGGLSVLGAGSAQGAVQQEFFVSPAGSGIACSSGAPCTLAQAQTQVRALVSAGMSGDLVVNLKSGTYTDAISLTAADSGVAESKRVIYRRDSAASVGAVIVSGGTSVSGWSLHDSGKNIWKADYSGADTRQIWVNGVRARVASQPASTVFGSVTRTSTGFTYSGTPAGSTYTGAAPSSWTHIDRVAFGFTDGWPWTSTICPASTITATAIGVAQPCHAAAGAIIAVGTPSEVQNNYELLSEPGQFYVDTTADKMYYIPRADETLSTASVVAADREDLLVGEGVKYLTVEGITFSYGTWRWRSGVGYLNAQGNALLKSNDLNDQEILPSSVACHDCENVTFRRNTFTRMGGSGLTLDGGGVSNLAEGNVFTDISGNGINVGTGYPGTDDWQPAQYEDGTVLANNYLFDIANEYVGGVGIWAGWVKNTSIRHNEITGISYSGISLGWGAGAHGVSAMVNNHVDYNYVRSAQTSTVHDGGAIYINGTHESTPRSSITGNVVDGLGQPYGSLYLDNGVSYYDVTNNVVAGRSPKWGLVQSYSVAAHHNTMTSNYVAATAGPLHDAGNSTNTVSGNYTALTSWPTAALAIGASAGLETTFQDIVGTNGVVELASAPTTTVSASSSFSTSYPASAAADGLNSTMWVSGSASSDPAPWWRADLGAQKAIRKIEVLFNQSAFTVNERRDFKVRVSNNANMSGATTVCERKTIPVSYEGRFDCTLPAGTWRYVSVDKGQDGMAFSEVRIYAAARVFGTPPPIASAVPQSFNADTGTWSTQAGATASRLAVDASGDPWVVGTDTSLKRWNGTAWVTVFPADVKDIAIGANGTVAIISNTSGVIYRSTDSGATWSSTNGSGTAIAVDSAGAIWAVGATGLLWKSTGATTWVEIDRPAGSTRLIADVGAVGSTVVVATVDGGSSGMEVFVRNGASWTTTNGSAVHVSGDAGGTVWAQSASGAVWSYASGAWTLRKSAGAVDVGAPPTSTGTTWIAAS